MSGQKPDREGGLRPGDSEPSLTVGPLLWSPVTTLNGLPKLQRVIMAAFSQKSYRKSEGAL